MNHANENGRLALVVYAGMLMMAVFAWWMSLPPRPLPADAPAIEFSAHRAFVHVEAMAKEPHPVGSKANEEVAEYIVAQLEAMGVEHTYERPIVRSGSHSVEQWGAILARVPGTASTGTFAVDAHFDSTPYGPGAADDLSGCAAMLESIRALLAGPPLMNDVVFCFADKEEVGGGGPKAFMMHPWFEGVCAVLGLEARGTAGPALMFETGPDNGFMIRQMAQAGVYPRATSIMFDIYDRMPFGSDFSQYKARGLPGLNVAYIDDFAYYHTMLDDPAHLSLASLQHHGAYTLGLSKQLGSVDLSNTRAPNATYFNTVGSHMVVYPRTWGWPITSLALGVFLAAMAVGLARRQLSIGGVLAGMGLFVGAALTAVIITGASSYVVFQLFQERALYRNNLFSLSTLLMGAGILVLFARLARGRLRVQNLFAGLLVLWAAMLLALQIVLPGGAYAATGPLLFMSLGMLALLPGRESAVPSGFRHILAVLSVAPGVLMLAPTFVVLSYTLTAMAMPLASVLMLLLLAMLLPPLHLVSARSHTRAGLVCVALAAGVYVAAIVGNSPSPERPLLNCLSYAVDYDAGEAFYISREEKLDPWLRNFFDDDTVRVSLDEYFGRHDPTTYLKALAPDAPFDRLVMEVLEDRVEGDRRFLRMWVKSPLLAQRIYLRLPPEVTVHSSSALGHALEGGDRRGWWLLLDTIPHEGGEVELEVEAGQPLVFKTREVAYHIPQIEGMPPRPDWMMTQTNRMLFRHRAIQSNHTYAIGTVTL